jgi:hypothetical protein
VRAWREGPGERAQRNEEGEGEGCCGNPSSNG